VSHAEAGNKHQGENEFMKNSHGSVFRDGLKGVEKISTPTKTFNRQ
jgi:hypothetical protein